MSAQTSETGRVSPDWAQAVAQDAGQKIITSEMLLSSEKHGLEDDHIFAALISYGVIEDLTGYYDVARQRFTAVVRLGEKVCGWPRIVHGGLTAAIIDESLGGLLFGLKEVAFTASLEVQYKEKIPALSTLLCTTEVESTAGRKLWMIATVSDGPEGTVYATARALFIKPRPQPVEAAPEQQGSAAVAAG